MKRSTVFAILSLAIICISLISWQMSKRQTPNEIRIGSFSTAIDYAPYLIAKERGDIERSMSNLGKTVSYLEFQSLPSINEALATGNVDFVFEAAPPAIIGKSAGIPIRIIGIGATLDQEIIVHSKSDINTVEDLSGKKIGVLAGTSSNYGILKSLEAAGVPAKNVDIIDMSPPDGKAAFASNQIDAWAIWPPFVEQELVAGTGRVLVGGDAQIQSVIVAREAILVDPKVSQEFLAVIERTKSWMLSNPTEAKQMTAEVLDLPLEVVNLAWEKHDWSASINDTVIDDLSNKATFLYDIGVVDNLVNVRDDLISK